MVDKGQLRGQEPPPPPSTARVSLAVPVTLAYLHVILDFVDIMGQQLGGDDPGRVVEDELGLAKLGVRGVQGLGESAGVGDVERKGLDLDVASRLPDGPVLGLELLPAPRNQDHLVVTLRSEELGSGDSWFSIGSLAQTGRSLVLDAVTQTVCPGAWWRDEHSSADARA